MPCLLLMVFPIFALFRTMALKVVVAAVFLIISVSQVASIGNDLKTIFSMLDTQCGNDQTSCQSLTGKTCCQFPLVSQHKAAALN